MRWSDERGHRSAVEDLALDRRGFERTPLIVGSVEDVRIAEEFIRGRRTE